MPSRKTAGRYCGHLEFVAALTRAFPTMIATTTATLANMAADQTTATLATMTLASSDLSGHLLPLPELFGVLDPQLWIQLVSGHLLPLPELVGVLDPQLWIQLDPRLWIQHRCLCPFVFAADCLVSSSSDTLPQNAGVDLM